MKKVISIMKVILLEYAVSVIMLMITALIMYKTGIGQKTTGYIIILIYFISNLCGGFVMGRIQKSRRLIWGSISGILYFVVLIFVSFILNGTFLFEGEWAFVLISCVLGGCAGALIS